MHRVLRTGLLIVVGTVMLAACQRVTGIATDHTAPGAVSTPAASDSSITILTDSQLDLDQQAIDRELNQLEKDALSVDRALSDMPIDIDE